MGLDSWELAARRVAHRSWQTVAVNWHLGFTAFGGPPVHFKIFHDKFVTKLAWIDEQLFQELFSVAQALSGPASTKMLYCINLIHDGSLGAVLSFLLWSVPGAIGMLGLAVGVSSIGEALPRPVYALLSGLNAATVGIITLAAVELSQKAITDKLTTMLVFLTASAGILYNALWYFPVLMFAAGCATVLYDLRAFSRWGRALGRFLRLGGRSPWAATGGNPVGSVADENAGHDHESHSPGSQHQHEPEPRIVPEAYRLDFSWKTGSAIIATFLATFVLVMVLRGVLRDPPLLYKLFSNLYLAGTIIFGGGPVVIPLLREYVVAEGWVMPRDFLIGLAITQAFPGPNFNFAVFLGALTAIQGGYPSAVGALVAFGGIFLPGIALVHGTMGIWGSFRSAPWVKSGLRGVNAGAVGLIYAAVYRIWQVGYLDEGFQSGRSLGDDPWWVVVSAAAYVGGRHFGLAAPLAIMLGAVMGLVRYGVVMGRGK